MSISLPQFPDGNLLTNSAEQAFKICPRKFYLSYRLGLRPAHHADALRVGIAFHLGQELIETTGDVDAAVGAIRQSYVDTRPPPWMTSEEWAVDEETSVALVVGHHRRWKDEPTLRVAAVELPFDIAIANPLTGRETPVFRSAGKIDAIVGLLDGRLAVRERKTTGESIELGSDYWRRLVLDAQISRYVLAARELGYPVETIQYDVTRKPAIKPKQVTKAERAYATSTANYFGLPLTEACPERETPAMYGARLLHDMAERPDFYFARQEIPRLDADLDEFRAEQWQIQRAIRAAEIDGRWYRNTGACLAMGRCTYFDVCRTFAGSPTEIPPGFRRAERLHEELGQLEGVTTMNAPNTRTAPPPAAGANGSPPPAAGGPRRTFTTSRGVTRTANRVVIYGPGGAGKSSLGAMAPGVMFADIERSTEDLDVARVEGLASWQDLRDWLNSDSFADVKTVCIDSATKAEEWCIQHVVKTVRNDKGGSVDGIEGFGYGKGYVYVFEEWRKLLADLDAHYRKGRNIVLICHDTDGKAPNPDGEDFLRHQPRLQNSEKASVMKATVEWSDHTLFIGYDSAVKDGKAKGSGTRTIYSAGTPTIIAKTRSLDGQPMPFLKGDRRLWDLITKSPSGAAADGEAPPL